MNVDIRKLNRKDYGERSFAKQIKTFINASDDEINKWLKKMKYSVNDIQIYKSKVTIIYTIDVTDDILERHLRFNPSKNLTDGISMRK